MSNNKQSSVDKDFVPYTESLAVEELGFDEHCFAWYVSENYGLEFGGVFKEDLIRDAVLAPTFSQVFRFFRENYNLIGGVQYMGGLKPETTWWDIYVIGHFNTSILAMTIKYQPYEEAELDLLKKLIEITKTKS